VRPPPSRRYSIDYQHKTHHLTNHVSPLYGPTLAWPLSRLISPHFASRQFDQSVQSVQSVQSTPTA
jgi:hypothetical protein